jgi:hypothetical protein
MMARAVGGVCMRSVRGNLAALLAALLLNSGAAASAQEAMLLARETFDPTLLPSSGLMRLASAPPTLAEGSIEEGQVFLSIPVRHAITAMSSAGREVDVVQRNGRPRGRPNRPSDVLPVPAPFYLTVLSDAETGTPVFWWCTPGEGLRAGPMCTGGQLDLGRSNKLTNTPAQAHWLRFVILIRHRPRSMLEEAISNKNDRFAPSARTAPSAWSYACQFQVKP